MKGRRRSPYAGPLVAKEHIVSYLQRDADDWDWIKGVNRKEALREIGSDFVFSYAPPPYEKPFIHQLQCFMLGMELPHFLFFLDMGGGKTALTLALIRWHMQHSNLRRTLICVPKEVNIQSWIDQIALHAPQLTYVVINGTIAERQARAMEEADIYIVAYRGLQFVMTELVRISKKSKRKKRQLTDKAKQFAKRFGMVVYDESHRVGNTESLVYNECLLFTKHVRRRYALTGTPFGRDPLPLFAQCSIVDGGETLGRSLGMFRAAFYDVKKLPWGITYEFDKRVEDDLHRLLKHRSIYYRDTEFSDLPPIPPPIRVRCPFTVEGKDQYEGVIRRIQESRGSKDEVSMAFAHMRMCTSGYVSMRSDIVGKVTAYFEENPKLDALEEIVLGIPEDTKAIIFHDYIITGNVICRLLTRLKLKYVTVSGQTKDQMASMRSFLKDDDVRFMVANNESGSTGINPQEVCSYVIFYESPVNPTTRKQAIKRVHREGQKRRIHIYDLVVPGSVDERILSFLDEGKDLFDTIIRGGKRALLKAA